MMVRIAYLDPVPTKNGLSLFEAELRRYANHDTQVSYHTLKQGFYEAPLKEEWEDFKF